MLKLEFTLYPQDFGPEPLFDEAVMLGTFQGFQTFIIDSSDFSGEMPLLYFARSLKTAVRQLNRNEPAFPHQDLDSEWRISFSRCGDFVEVSDNQKSPVIGLVKLSELTAAAEGNAQQAFQACLKVYPKLREEVWEWWTQFD
ncbi:MAG: hypothetical protein JSS83_23875 [Cyanobacteria bacterium SZAS LIN-3]|nr:hypothetical protein [Cyanobacteria bacterium SZAS LIN-3]